MAGITLKRNVVLRAIVTDQLKQQVSAELQAAAAEVDERIAQMDAQTRGYITQLQQADLSRAMAVRKQIEAERQKQLDLKDALLERKAQVQELENGTEVVRGTLESYVEVKEGDDLGLLMGGTEIVTKDDVIIEIRQRRVLDEAEAADTPSLILPGDLQSGG